MAEPLQEKYRPQIFEDFFGNKDAITGLKATCRREKGPPPAFLLIGPKGCGKTTLAGIIKKELKVDDKDFVEMNTANVRGIDSIREIDINCRFAALGGTRKIYFFDECHKLTNDAQNALLKLLEKPPGHVTFILATTDPQMLIATLKDRCTIYEVSLLSNKEIKELVKAILKKEKIFIPEQAIDEIVIVADGGPRAALVLLDAVIDIEDDDDLINAIKGYNTAEATVKELCQALLNNQDWKTIAKLVKAITDDPEKIRYAILGYMSAVLLNSGKPRAAEVMVNFMDSFMYTKKSGLVLACFLSTKN